MTGRLISRAINLGTPPLGAVGAGDVVWRSSGASSANRFTASRWPFVGPLASGHGSRAASTGGAVKLSVCCLTADPGPRVAAVLGQLRDVADEIVVAVDSRVEETWLGHHARIADRVIRFEFAPPIERARPWLYALCAGNWILEIDDDEVLSSSFLSQVPDLIRDWRYWQYWVPCHWLFPDATHWLDEPPWSFDSNRLVRNDPTTLWAAGLSHTRADPAFPSSHLERGFYHLAYLLTSESQRREKVAHYLGIADVHRIPSTDRDMAELYMPEEVAGTRPVSVPRADRKAIAAVLEATGPGLPTPPSLEVPLAVRAEIDAHWPERTMSAAAYEAKLEILDRVVHLAPGEHRPVHVRITNRETRPGRGRAARTDGRIRLSTGRNPAVLSVVSLRRSTPGRGGLPDRPSGQRSPGRATVVPVSSPRRTSPAPTCWSSISCTSSSAGSGSRHGRRRASVDGRPGVEPAALGLLPDGRPGSEGCRGIAPVPRGRGRDRRRGRFQAR